MPTGHHYALVLELRPVDELYACEPCECYWVNDSECFNCGNPGTLLIGKSSDGGSKPNRRFTEQVLDISNGNPRVISPSVRFSL